MEVQQLIRRPAACCLSLSSPYTTGTTRLLASAKPALTPLTSYRHASSRRRLKKALNIPPHPSFLDTFSKGGSASSETIVINPPSSAPSVYHTPFKFLPKEDPRRRANLASLFSSARSASTTIAYNDPNLHGLAAAAGTTPGDTPLPPRFMTKNDAELLPTRHHLTEEDVAEMRRLRAEDPETHSVVALSRRFKCSKLFVLMCCQASRDHQQRRKEEKLGIINRWGPRKQAAVNERRRRLDMLF